MATTKQARKPVAKKTTAKTSAGKSKATKPQAAEAFEALKDNFSDLQDSAQKVWLAGLGAVGVSIDEVKDRYEQINQDGEKLVKELIARGEEAQVEATDLISERRTELEGQIETVRNQITDFTADLDIPARLQDISDKLEEVRNGWKKTA